jgi:phenylpyruvate tautomerase PptA (4-oxalocrotonate tautomerase family)
VPVIQVHHLEGALDDDTKADLARRLTDALIVMEGGANTRGGRAFAWVLFTPVKPGDWWIGGRRDDQFVVPPGRSLVHVTIPEGYMNAQHKSEVHASINAAIVAATGCDGESSAGASALVVIDEVTEGNWGAAGRTKGRLALTAKVDLPRLEGWLSIPQTGDAPFITFHNMTLAQANCANEAGCGSA